MFLIQVREELRIVKVGMPFAVYSLCHAILQSRVKVMTGVNLCLLREVKFLKKLPRRKYITKERLFYSMAISVQLT